MASVRSGRSRDGRSRELRRRLVAVEATERGGGRPGAATRRPGLFAPSAMLSRLYRPTVCNVPRGPVAAALRPYYRLRPTAVEARSVVGGGGGCGGASASRVRTDGVLRGRVLRGLEARLFALVGLEPISIIGASRARGQRLCETALADSQTRWRLVSRARGPGCTRIDRRGPDGQAAIASGSDSLRVSSTACRRIRSGSRSIRSGRFRGGAAATAPGGLSQPTESTDRTSGQRPRSLSKRLLKDDVRRASRIRAIEG